MKNTSVSIKMRDTLTGERGITQRSVHHDDTSEKTRLEDWQGKKRSLNVPGGKMCGMVSARSLFVHGNVKYFDRMNALNRDMP